MVDGRWWQGNSRDKFVRRTSDLWFSLFIRNNLYIKHVLKNINIKDGASFHESNLPDVVIPDVGGGADDGNHGGLHPPALEHRAAS